jgi:hypothetical protein
MIRGLVLLVKCHLVAMCICTAMVASVLLLWIVQDTNGEAGAFVCHLHLY